MQNSTTCARTNHGKTVFLFVYIQTNYIISLLTIYKNKKKQKKINSWKTLFDYAYSC